MNATLLNLPPFTLMELWGELIECLHGVHGYGGDTAEIYAYRFQMYNPAAHSRLGDTERGETRRREIAKESNWLLMLLCAMFIERHDCGVLINDIGLNEWPVEYLFDHRVHVTVVAKRETQ